VKTARLQRAYSSAGLSPQLAHVNASLMASPPPPPPPLLLLLLVLTAGGFKASRH